MSEVPKLLTLLEVALILKISPHTVRSFVRKGTLKPVPICRRLLFHPDDLVKLVGHSTSQSNATR